MIAPIDPVTAIDELGDTPTGDYDEAQMGNMVAVGTAERLSGLSCVPKVYNLSANLTDNAYIFSNSKLETIFLQL